METLLIHPEDSEQLKALKTILKALKVDFESTKESPYNKAFVNKIKQSRKLVSIWEEQKGFPG